MPITGIADVHTHRQDAGRDAIINLPLGAAVPEGDGVYSVGIHPWEAAEADWAWLEAAAQHPRVVAIGEAGLDKLRGPDLQVQEEAFVRQIQLSERLQKPLIIHCVKSMQRVIELRKELRAKQQWIYHGFRGNPVMARQLLRAGIDISIGEKYNPAILSVIPPSRLYHETD